MVKFQTEMVDYVGNIFDIFLADRQIRHIRQNLIPLHYINHILHFLIFKIYLNIHKSTILVNNIIIWNKITVPSRLK